MFISEVAQRQRIKAGDQAASQLRRGLSQSDLASGRMRRVP